MLLIIYIPRMIWKDQQRGSVSLLLTIATALVLIIFATVASVAYLQLVAQSSSLLVRGGLLVFLLGMGALLRICWTSKSVA
ncbi:MAG: hypothetical protein ACRD4R_16745 [Candidatus Acidiferrales bacterium]